MSKIETVERGLFGSIVRERELDDFFTTPAAALRCMAWLQPHLTGISVLLEPSAGSGAFVAAAAKVTPQLRTIAYDLYPRAPRIAKRDWFTVHTIPEHCAVFGNPPFGRVASTAIAFVNRAADLKADIIAFVLPRSFRKASVQKRLDPRLKLLAVHDLDDNSFELPDGTPYRVRTCFCIWARSVVVQRIQPAAPLHFPLVEFVAPDEAWDWAVRRVGGRAGKVVGVDGALDGSAAASSTMFLRAYPERKDIVAKFFDDFDPLGARDSANVNSYPKSMLLQQLADQVKMLPAMSWPTNFELSGDFMGLGNEATLELFNQGQIWGLAGPKLLDYMFANVRFVAATNDLPPYIELIRQDGKGTINLIHRVNRSSGYFDLNPSKFVGVKRKSNRDGFLAAAKRWSGFQLTDISEYPILKTRTLFHHTWVDRGMPERISLKEALQ